MPPPIIKKRLKSSSLSSQWAPRMGSFRWSPDRNLPCSSRFVGILKPSAIMFRAASRVVPWNFRPTGLDGPRRLRIHARCSMNRCSKTGLTTFCTASTTIMRPCSASCVLLMSARTSPNSLASFVKVSRVHGWATLVVHRLVRRSTTSDADGRLCGIDSNNSEVMLPRSADLCKDSSFALRTAVAFFAKHGSPSLHRCTTF
mmetsp:Transcript_45603/g.90442  ORF Transcript_45603/g.90442 Transcript_45603/m.90442 type:complete len:201 (+) Transcript_45603:1917-2519(+)